MHSVMIYLFNKIENDEKTMEYIRIIDGLIKQIDNIKPERPITQERALVSMKNYHQHMKKLKIEMVMQGLQQQNSELVHHIFESMPKQEQEEVLAGVYQSVDKMYPRVHQCSCEREDYHQCEIPDQFGCADGVASFNVIKYAPKSFFE